MRTVKALYYQCILKAFTYLGEIKESSRWISKRVSRCFLVVLYHREFYYPITVDNWGLVCVL